MFRILTILLLSSTLFPNVTNNGATLTIGSDVSVFIDGNFINNGIDVRMIKFQEKDPNEIGFESLLYLINRTKKTKFSDLMRVRLNGKTKKHMEIQ